MRFILLLTAAAAFLSAESIAGLKWTSPPSWTNQGSRPMRAATYAIPGDGECIVYFFGATQGGSVEANIERWKGQMQRADGKPVESKVAKRTIHGLPVTTSESAGDYNAAAGPTATEKIIKPGFVLLGAIVEGPGGNIFIKFAGPAKTVEANRAKFGELLNSFDKE